MSVPAFLRPITRPLYRSVTTSRVWRRLSHRPESRDRLHEYWRRPWDGDNLPDSYVEGDDRSAFLFELIARHSSPDARVLELGCNVGRNLRFLLDNGYERLEAIEISGPALERMKDVHPHVAAAATVHNAPLEDVLPTLPDGSFDVVFSLAVLEHIHPDSESVFAEIARVAGGVLVTVEDEAVHSWRHFPRNYRKIFEPLGLEQVEERSCRDVPTLGPNSIGRVFVRRAS
jgi:SAM-dependent methyltransferase